jgi:hypothetical protein
MGGLIKINNNGAQRTGGLAGALANKTGGAASMPIAQTDATFYDQHLKQDAKVGFIIDATGSRSSTWKQAKEVQADMLRQIGDNYLQVKVVHFGGDKPLKNTKWEKHANSLISRMNEVECEGGATQINEALDHYIADQARPKIVVLIGDCFEENKASAFEKARAMKSNGT